MAAKKKAGTNPHNPNARRGATTPNQAGEIATGAAIEARRREVTKGVIAGTPRSLLAQRFGVSERTIMNDARIGLQQFYGPQQEEVDAMRIMITEQAMAMLARHFPLSIAKEPNYDSAAVVDRTWARLSRIWGLESITVKQQSTPTEDLSRMFAAIDAELAAAQEAATETT